MRRSDHPSRPRARICCCLVSSKTLLMPATELAFRPDVNVSIATGNGRFSPVDQWPVLGVHRGLRVALDSLLDRLKAPSDVFRCWVPIEGLKLDRPSARFAGVAFAKFGRHQLREM